MYDLIFMGIAFLSGVGANYFVYKLGKERGKVEVIDEMTKDASKLREHMKATKRYEVMTFGELVEKLTKDAGLEPGELPSVYNKEKDKGLH